MTKILVTGAGGFVGKHLIEALLKSGESDVWANVYSATSDLTDLLPTAKIIPTDLTDLAASTSLIQKIKPELIYHLASLSVVQDSSEKASSVLVNNLKLHYNLLEAIRLNTPKSRIITISTGNVYGNADPAFIPMTESAPLKPLNPYAVSKLCQEFLTLQYHLAYNLDAVILRPFNHAGAGQTTNFIIPMLARQFVGISRGEPPVIKLGNIETKRDFTDVRDMCQAYILAASHCKAGEVYNIGSGVGVSIHDIIAHLEDLTRIKVTITVDQDKIRSSDVPLLVADSSKFRSISGWSPKIPLRDTLKSVLAYWKEQR